MDYTRAQPSRSFWLLLIIGATAIWAAGCNDKSDSGGHSASGEIKKVRVEAFKVTPHRFENVISVPGNVLPFKKAMIGVKVPGQVKKVRVREGQAVQKGAVLIEIERDDFILALKQAKAQLAAAKAAKKNANVGISSLKRQRERLAKLLEQNVITRAEFEKVDDQYEMALANLDAASAQQQLAKVGVDTARSKLSGTRILAPFDGTVTRVMTEEGEMVSTMPPSPIMELMDLSQVKVEGNVTERDLGFMDGEVQAHVTMESIPNEVFNGTAQIVSPSLDLKTRTTKVRVVLPNRETRFKPGMSATIELRLDEIEILAIPRDAIVRSSIGEGKAVFVISGQHALELRTVKLGLSDTELLAITHGLKSGDLIVRSPSDDLRTGVEVEVVSQRGGRQ